MFQHWAFSHPGAANEGRAERQTADLRVAVVIPFESWQLMWTIRSINISNTGVLCAADVTDQASAQKATDLNTLLDAEPEVQLQIDSPTDELFAATVPARLTRKTKKPWGLELAFHFNTENEELMNLVASLEQGPPFAARRNH
jgi:hypothetical protein